MTPSSAKSPNSPKSPTSTTTEERKEESENACEEDTPDGKSEEENKKGDQETLEEEESDKLHYDMFPAEETNSKTHCTSSFNQAKKTESVNAKVSQDSGIASLSRRDSYLSIADEGTVFNIRYFWLFFFNSTKSCLFEIGRFSKFLIICDQKIVIAYRFCGQKYAIWKKDFFRCFKRKA